MNYSIDKMLNIVPSKYQLVYVASKRELQLGERISVKILDCDEYTLTGEEYVSE